MPDPGIKKIQLEQLDVQKEIASNTDPEKTAPPSNPSLPANTTAEEDITTAGQRHINVMWESTQRAIAIAVTVAVLGVCLWIVVKGPEPLQIPAFTVLSSVFFLVVGTYFQRTNHTKIGGVGHKPGEVYLGR